MNLYIFNETRRGAVFGIGTYVCELISALKNSDIHLCVVNLLSDRPQITMEESGNVQYWYFPEPIPDVRVAGSSEQRRMYFHNVVYLLQLYIQDRTDLLFHLNFPQCEGLVDELKNAFDCKVVSVVHFSQWGFAVFDNLPRLRSILNEENPDSSNEEIKKVFEEDRSYYSKVDCCVCLSEYMREILCREYELDAVHISVVPNGLSDVPDVAVDIESLRKKWNIQAGEKIILFVGRLDDVKGIVYLIRAFRTVLEICPEARLIIAGSGNFDTCLREAKTICTKVTFTGLLEKEELYELYRMAAVGVVSSLFEPFGYVAVEMMIHTVPLVVTATSGLNEVVDSACGLKIPLTVLPDRVEIDTLLLAQKIVYLLQHPEEAKVLGLNGRKRYLANYSSEIFRRNMFHLYQSL
ncbi:TIGR04157 family glycosyltransferase [uncultured Parabacteroides sp.]|uniref:TIGR04157 family glycosyltransferase n=1 Tax=uncultured Parabacteroides sp. TaxID=512312 RepID=UPI002630CDB4|nr:TIGR04157 family glycosyltransferase [uncultured Parabacteroides sp.]